MKLVSYVALDGSTRCGIYNDRTISELDVTEMRSLFERTGGVPADIEKLVVRDISAGDVSLVAPIAPKKLIHTAGNYKEHAEESRRVGWSHDVGPWIVFLQNVDAIIGPNEGIRHPAHLTSELDHEIELCVVIRDDCRDFGVEEAMSHVAGYVIFNDVTARDIQRDEMKSGVFGFCKGIQSFCPIGPWIVTADEIPDPHQLDIELRVNGSVRQKSNTSHMWTTIPEILARYSPLGYSAGDIVTTGTVAGVAGFRVDADEYYLRVGDVVECEIEGIGVLRNPVVEWN